MEGKELDAACAKYEGDYLESADLMHRPPCVLQIAEVVPPCVEKDATKRLIDKPIFRFEKATKRMIMGKTNQRIVKAIHGNKASGWIGQTVTIGVRYIDLPEALGGKDCPTLRVIPPDGVPIPVSARRWYGTEKPKHTK